MPFTGKVLWSHKTIAMPNPVTCENCATSLPANSQSICTGKTIPSQVQRLFLTLLNEHANFDAPSDTPGGTEVNDPVAWSARMDQSAASDGAIVSVHVIGNKPRPEVVKTEMSLGRSKQTGQKHQIQFKADEFNPTAHDFWRKVSQCGGTFGLWYETSGKHLWGSTEGIEIPIRVNIAAGMVIPVERAGVIVWEGEVTWEDLGTENYIDSPVPDVEEPVES